MISFRIETKRREQPVLITQQVQDAVQQRNIEEGICVVHCPHTTAGLTINECADPDVMRDMFLALDKAFPDRPEFRHFEGNSAAHVKATVTGSSVTIPIKNGQLMLGRWQGIWFCEFDGPRTRQFYLQLVKEK